MKTSIEINNLIVNACHGVYDFEKKNQQPFSFSCKINVDFIEAAISDDLSKSISYCDIMQDINDFCTNNCFNLIETLAYKVSLMLIKKYKHITSIIMTVKKPKAPYPLSFEDVGVTVEMGWHEAYLSLGSNLGNKEENLQNAIKQLDSYPEIEIGDKSNYFYNPPYGGVATEEFVNMAVKVKTLFSPEQLLEKIHEVESTLGRVRDIHWGNRNIDIDIVFYDHITLNTDDLIIPHKDYKNRDFVVKPMSEIAPNYIAPGESEPLKLKKI